MQGGNKRTPEGEVPAHSTLVRLMELLDNLEILEVQDDFIFVALVQFHR